MDKEKMSNELKVVFQLLSGLNVNGDAVDVMAAVRAKLRKLVAELEKEGDDNG